MARAELEELRTQLATVQTQLAERSRLVSEITAELNALRNAQSELEQRITEARFPLCSHSHIFQHSVSLVCTLVSSMCFLIWLACSLTCFHRSFRYIPVRCACAPHSIRCTRSLQIHSLKIELKERSEAISRLQLGLHSEKVLDTTSTRMLSEPLAHIPFCQHRLLYLDTCVHSFSCLFPFNLLRMPYYLLAACLVAHYDYKLDYLYCLL